MCPGVGRPRSGVLYVKDTGCCPSRTSSSWTIQQYFSDFLCEISFIPTDASVSNPPSDAVDWICCAPPRDLVREFLAYGLRVARVGVALRMYLYFLEPCTVRVPALLDPVQSRHRAAPQNRGFGQYVHRCLVCLAQGPGCPRPLHSLCRLKQCGKGLIRVS